MQLQLEGKTELLRRWLLAPVEWFREWREAQARAAALLRECLTDAEYATLRSQGHLVVASRAFEGRTYRIPADGGRVKVFEEGELSGELCVAPVGPVPTGDVVLSHKLMIEACEEEYLQVARWIQPLPPEFPQFGLYYDFGRLRAHLQRREHPAR